MKIIFLDIDGVLDIFNRDEFLQTILGDAVARLQRIVRETNAKIVIISNWRYGCERYRELFGGMDTYKQERANWKLLEPALMKYGLEIYDVSPWEEYLETRSDEIKYYLEMHPEITGYVILDDCFFEDYEKYDELKQRLVLVDANKGLQEVDVDKALEILKR